MTTMTVFNREEMVAWLGSNGYIKLSDQVYFMEPNMAIIGQPASDVVLSLEVKILIGSELHRKLECDVVSITLDLNQIHIWGI